MPKFTPRQQQTRASSPRATAESFGAMEGRAMEGMGNSLQGVGQNLEKIEAARRNRESIVDSVRKQTQYKETVDAEYMRMQSEEDMADPAVVKKFQEFSRSKADEMLGTFSGTAQVRTDLANSLEQMRSGYSRSSYEESVKLGWKALGQQADDKYKQIGNTAYTAPEHMAEAVTEWNEYIDAVKGAMPAEMEDNYRQAGQAHIAGMAITRYMDMGDVDAAEEIMNAPGVLDALDVQQARQFRTNITSHRFESQRQQVELNNKIKIIDDAMGGLTRSEKAVLLGVASPSSGGKMNAAQIITEMESTLKRPLTDEQKMRVYEGVNNFELTGKTDAPSYGKSMQGLAYGRMVDTVASINTGSATEDVVQQFANDYSVFMTPKVDTRTGQVIYPELPESMQQAAAKLGITVSETPRDIAEPNRQSPNYLEELDSEIPIDSTTNLPRTLWDRADSLTGVVDKLAKPLASRVGWSPGDTNQVVQDQAFVKSFSNKVVTAMQNNPKFAEGERETIKSELDLLGGAIDTENNYRQKMIGLNEVLEESKQSSAKEMLNPYISPADRQAHRKKVTLLTEVQQAMGIPRQVQTKDELEKLVNEGVLKTGDYALDPQGRLLRIP